MLPIQNGSLRLFQFFGIHVYVHWTWFLVAYFQITWFRGAFEGAYWHVLVYLSLFGIVLLHEFGHALACRQTGGRADAIILWPLGGIAYVMPPQRPGPVLWSIAAGPLVNVALLPLLLAVAWIFGAGLGPDHTDLQRYLFFVNSINLGLLVFNILPIYPLDGGQILQAILWFFMKRSRSLFIAAGFGLFVAVAAAVPVLLIRDWWLLLILAFVAWQAWTGIQRARYLAQFEREEQEPWRM